MNSTQSYKKYINIHIVNYPSGVKCNWQNLHSESILRTLSFVNSHHHTRWHVCRLICLLLNLHVDRQQSTSKAQPRHGLLKIMHIYTYRHKFIKSLNINMSLAVNLRKYIYNGEILS